MKICIPIKANKGYQSEVNEHFGSAPKYLVCSTDKTDIEVLSNTDHVHEHGMCNPLDELAGKGIDAVVCMGMGGRAVKKLNQKNIKAFKVLGGTVEDIIDKLNKGEMEEITIDAACNQHQCH
ncbi:MAG: NifB/NifX family molybdenum-iron cluster-binding protein [bacterium]